MIACNATPLIYLAKIGKLQLLKDLYSTVLITEEVKEEVVDRGQHLGKKDAYLIEQAIGEGWIRVEKVKAIKLQIELEKGEASTISLAKAKDLKEVLIDEASARTAAKLNGLEPKGTIFILLKALALRLIDLSQFLELLQRLVQEGFRLKEEVYIEAIEKAREIARSETRHI